MSKYRETLTDDPDKLKLFQELAKLRKEAGLTQTRVAAHFRLGNKGRDTVRDWEYGYSRPDPNRRQDNGITRRQAFIAYFLDLLHLRRSSARFLLFWNEIVVGVWGWPEIDDEEWRHYLPGTPKPTTAPTTQPSQETPLVSEGGQPISADAVLDACKAQVESVLYEERHKYDPELYVNRAIEAALNQFFDTSSDVASPHCFLIVAPAGSGKTNLLCNLARVRVIENHQPTLVLRGGSIVSLGGAGLLGVIQEELQTAAGTAFRSAGECLHTLHRLAETQERDALILLDAINEYPQTKEMRGALADLLRKTRGLRIKLVITCRDLYWGQFEQEDFWKGTTVNLPAESDERETTQKPKENFYKFSEAEFKQAWPLYRDRKKISGELKKRVAEECRHPLLLLFFCEAYEGRDVTEFEDIVLKELFDNYWDKKLKSIASFMSRHSSEWDPKELAEALGAYLQNLAVHMLHYNVRAILREELPQATQREEEYQSIGSFYGRIRNEHIILEEVEQGRAQQHKVRRVKFVYEEFMEYVMARALVELWAGASPDEILAEIKRLKDKYEKICPDFWGDGLPGAHAERGA